MTYTLSMAADQGIRVAGDGVAEVSMTDARALLTRLIRRVRESRRAGAFTERGNRSAYVVTPDFYDQALRDRAVIVKWAERGTRRAIDDPVHLREELAAVYRALGDASSRARD